MRRWVFNAHVRRDYARRDLDRHTSELTAALGLKGAGVGMFTAANVRLTQRSTYAGVAADATVGLTCPIWACDSTSICADAETVPGTINIVAQLPVRLSDAALLNALCTATEAKAQALWEVGVPATGTASDAVTLCCPMNGVSAPFGGPRARWGAALAHAVHDAVRTGARVWLEKHAT